MNLLLEYRWTPGSILKSFERARKNHGSFATRAGKALGVHPAVILGILVKESGGAAARTGNSIHWGLMVRSHWAKKYKEKFPGRPMPSWSNVRMSKRQSVYEEAYSLWPRGALENTSWGIAQVHPWGATVRRLGYSSPEEMVRAFKGSVRAQEDSLIDFIRTKPGLLAAARSKDWWMIARLYNGDRGGKGYGLSLQIMHNSIAEEKDTSRIAKTRLEYEKMRKQGLVGVPSEEPESGASLRGARVVLIGDSNSFYLNNEYKKHYSARGASVLKLTWNGSGCRRWREILTAVVGAADGRPIAGSDKIAEFARKIYKFKPTNINVTSLGGNNMNQSYTESKMQAHVSGCVKPLMQLLKRFNGTFAGPPPIGKDRVGKTGERSNSLRAKMNAAYKKAAREVGIPYWDPTANIAYDTGALSRRKTAGEGDDIHLTSRMAGQEFKSRKAFLGGGPAPPRGAPEDDIEYEKTAEEKAAEEKKASEEFIGSYIASGGRSAPIPKLGDLLKVAGQEAERALGLTQGALDEPGATPTQAGKPSPTRERPSNACPDGVFTSKYKNFPAQVPDFDFSVFYSELDKYFDSAEEMLKPQGKDCVFSDEHYSAWSKLRRRKQQEVPYVAESLSLLHDLIKEMKKRY